MTTVLAPTRRRLFAVVAVAALAASMVVSIGGASASATERAERFLVQFRPGRAEEGTADLRQAGARIVVVLGPQNAVAALIPPDAFGELRGNPNIELIEQDVRRFLQAETTPYGVSMVQADQVSASAPGNRTIGIIDSGLYTGHEDAPAAVGIPETDWNVDLCGHGTHVAGTIAAVDNEVGVHGVDPGVNLNIVTVFGDDCSWTYASNLINALNVLLESDLGADVVNMSLGGSYRSRVEEKAFADAYKSGVLLVAAAGNDGNKRVSYPAGYASVISVAAVDADKARADFSQVNKDVELAAPGVDVLSTVPFIGTHTLTVGGMTFTGDVMEGAAETSGVTGALVDGGLCDAAGSWAGNIVVCERGTITFAEKVANVVGGGGAAAVIYNNEPGGFSGTLGDGTSTIPAISLSQEDGEAVLAYLGFNGTVVNEVVIPASGYEAWSGTSMATPHVAAVAALVWSCNPAWTNAQVRAALNATAQDLGAAGRDSSYGYGLVQAKAAQDRLLDGGSCSP